LAVGVVTGFRHAELVSAASVQRVQSRPPAGWMLKRVQHDDYFLNECALQRRGTWLFLIDKIDCCSGGGPAKRREKPRKR
jgi:hypothetical protein